MAVKVFTGSAEFKSLKREIDVVRSLPSHENIVMLFGDEEEVRALQQLLRMYYMCTYGTWCMYMYMFIGCLLCFSLICMSDVNIAQWWETQNVVGSN